MCKYYGWEKVEPINKLPVGANTNIALPQKNYVIVYADPPWKYFGSPDKMGAAGNHYPTMSLEEIKALPVRDLASKEAVCFMWTTSSHIISVNDVMEPWGFEYQSVAWNLIKCKQDGNPYGPSGGIPFYT